MRINSELEVTIKTLMKACNLSTPEDVVNNALTLLEYVVDQVGKGNEIAVLHKEGDVQIIRLPALQNISGQTTKSSPILYVIEGGRKKD